MGTVRIALFASLAVCSTSAAWAQYGLYGSPETLRLPQQETAQAYPAPASYPTTAASISQPAPAQNYYQPAPQYRYPAQTPATATYQPYQPAPQYRYPAQPPATTMYQPHQPAPQYRYPAQPPATAMYQPYQPGSQYQYPGPYSRVPVRTASVEQTAPIQPIPAPPGMPVAPGEVPAATTQAPCDAMAPQGSGMMNQMLTEQACGGCYGSDNGCGSNGVYRGAMGRFEQSACGPGPCAEGNCYDGNCGYCPWYASASVLVMGRSDGRRLWTSNEPPPRETSQLANTQFPMSWKWGGEVKFGRRFCCGCVPYAVEATYWTTEAFSGIQSTTNPNSPYTLNTPLVVSQITFGGASAQNWFDGADEHRLSRRDEFHNIEINLIHEQLAWGCDSPWDIGWSVGLRYFRFQEYLQFGARMDGYQWTDLLQTAFLEDTITNNLFGVQFGFDAAYNVFSGVRVFITPKVGVYNNYLDSTFQAHTGNGINGVAPSPYPGFPVHGTKNAISFLTQIDAGVDWQFSRNWSARAGYRVVAATGMGLADDQFVQYIVDTPEIQRVENYGTLVLHGAFMGLTYNF